MAGVQLMNTRIRLEPPSMAFVAENLEAVRESEHELRRFLDWVDHALTEEDTINNIRDAIDQFESFTTELRYSIVRQSDERFLGMIGLLIGDPAVPAYEMGYWLRSSETGKGYMRDAVSLLEHHVFTQLGAEKIEIRAENTGTGRLLTGPCCKPKSLYCRTWLYTRVVEHPYLSTI